MRTTLRLGPRPTRSHATASRRSVRGPPLVSTPHVLATALRTYQCTAPNERAPMVFSLQDSKHQRSESGATLNEQQASQPSRTSRTDVLPLEVSTSQMLPDRSFTPLTTLRLVSPVLIRHRFATTSLQGKSMVSGLGSVDLGTTTNNVRHFDISLSSASPLSLPTRDSRVRLSPARFLACSKLRALKWSIADQGRLRMWKKLAPDQLKITSTDARGRATDMTSLPFQHPMKNKNDDDVSRHVTPT
jgi:hypothetical protein